MKAKTAMTAKRRRKTSGMMQKTNVQAATSGHAKAVRIVATIPGDELNPPRRFLSSDPVPTSDLERQEEVERARACLIAKRRNDADIMRMRDDARATAELRELQFQFQAEDDYRSLFPCDSASAQSMEGCSKSGNATKRKAGRPKGSKAPRDPVEDEKWQEVSKRVINGESFNAAYVNVFGDNVNCPSGQKTFTRWLDGIFQSEKVRITELRGMGKKALCKIRAAIK